MKLGKYATVIDDGRVPQNDELIQLQDASELTNKTSELCHYNIGRPCSEAGSLVVPLHTLDTPAVKVYTSAKYLPTEFACVLMSLMHLYQS